MENKISDGQGRLIDEVINRGLCVRCGACVGLCPYFQYFDGRVVVLDKCRAHTPRCLQICPRADYGETSPDYESPGHAGEIGAYESILVARATDEEIRGKAQYGGVISALLIFALEKGEIKSAILTDRGGSLSPEGKIASNRAGVIDCAGSRYSASGGLSVLNRAIEAGDTKIGVVGLPCQMEALARMKRTAPDGEERSNRVAIKMGLFCTWALDYRKLAAFLKREKVEGTILKYDIPPPPSEKFQVLTSDGWIDFPLADLRPLVQKGCSLCEDMTAEWADISVGTVEGMEGWNTVIVRTRAGVELVTEAVKQGRLETDDLPGQNLAHLKEAAGNKRERGRRAKTEG